MILHQALFGYESGHNLLGGSYQLSAESRRMLAVLTDASGPWPSSGFDRVFTGVPLPDLPYYALFCTWPAVEMPRPGCVWSHVILIEMADLARIPNLGELQHIFRRPDEVGASWQKPIEFEKKYNSASPVPRTLESECKRFLTCLYGSSDLCCVAQTSESTTYEGLVFALWSQQWPRLRRAFRFSTGSFADRRRTGIDFDLQIAVDANRRDWADSSSFHLIKNVLPIEEKYRTPDWVAAAAADLLEPRTSELRDFLHSFGADVHRPREAFDSLVSARLRIEKTPPNEWNSVLEFIAKAFPDPTDAVRLKQASLEPEEAANCILRFLFQERVPPAYSQAAVSISGLISSLWPLKQEWLLNFLDQVLHGAPPERLKPIVEELSSRIEVGDLQSIWETNPRLVNAFIESRQDFAYVREAWQLPARIQWLLLDVLGKEEHPREFWIDIIAAMLSGGTEIGVTTVVENAGSCAIDGALQWFRLEERTAQMPPPVWREALWRQAKAALSEKLLTPIDRAFCIALLPPRVAGQLSPIDPEIQALAHTSLHTFPPMLRLYVAFFLTTMGLQASDAVGGLMLARGLFRTHEALAEQSEPIEAWQMLQHYLPRSWFWPEWDRCKSLENAVKNWLEKYPQAYAILSKAAVTPNDRVLIKRLANFSET